MSHTLQAAGSDYASIMPGTVEVTVSDDDTAAVNISAPAASSVNEEGGTTTYTVSLDTRPVGGDVTITPSSSVSALATLAPTALTFTATNWNTAQVVTFTAGMDADNVDTAVTVSHTLQAAGSDYASVTAGTVVVTVNDNDAPGVNLSDTLTVDEGMSSIYTMVLRSAPVGDVIITPSSSDSNAVMVSGALTFGAGNWNTAQSVTVTSRDDDNAFDETATVTHALQAGAGSGYDSVTVRSVVVTVNDDEMVAVNIPDTLTVVEGMSITYTVTLGSQPAGGDVVVTPSSTDANAAMVSGALTFSSGNWNTAQTVTLTGVEDDTDTLDNRLRVVHTASGADYDGFTAEVDVTVTDNDAPTVMISATTLTVSESGGTATYTVQLRAAPSDDVTVTPSSGGTAATVSAALIFTGSNWNTPQEVTVTGRDDPDSADTTVIVSHTVASAAHDGLTAPDVTVTVTDDDTRGLMISEVSGDVLEGASTATYTIQLTTQPVGGDVTVTPSSTAGDISLTPGRLMFTAGNWNAAQTVSINAAEDDNGADGAVTLNHAANGADYGGVTASIVATVADNDPPGVTVTPTNLAVPKGRTGTYTVRLDTEPHPPGATVTITINLMAPAQNRDEVAVAPASLTFDHRNWDTPQVVSVNSSTDADSAADPSIISHQVSGADYGSVTAPAVTVTIITSTLGDINEVILSEVARAMGDQQVSAISNRVLQAGQDGGGAAAFSLGGQSTLSGLAAANAKTLAADDFDLKRMLGGSSFVTPLNASGGALSGSLAFWGGGDYRDLSGKSQDIEWEGNLFSVHLGLDARLRSDLLVGLMVSDSEGDLDYEAADNQQGEYDIDLTSVNPYIGWSLMDGRLDMWATTGYGEGDLEITPDDAQSSTTADVTMKMMALGGAGELSRSERAVVRLKGEAFYTRTHVDDTTSDPRAAMVGNADIDAHRARMTVEMESRYGLAGGAQLKQSVEAGFRVDGGDGRTGSGLEVGGGLHYHDALRGLTLESRARALLAHSGDYDEWGISGSVRVDPGADGQGLSVALSPSYGKTGSAMQDIWNKGLLGEKAKKADQDDLQAHLTARLGYGLSAAPLNGRWGAWGDGMLTPYSAMTLGGGKQQYRLGLQWGAGKLFDLDLFATRQEQRGKADDHAVLLKGEVRF